MTLGAKTKAWLRVLPPLVVAGLVCWVCAPEIHRGIREVFVYQPAPGVVESFSPPVPGAEAKLATGRITYRYTFGGQEWTGQYPRETGRNRDPDEIRILDLPHEPRAALTVYVDPAQPDLSTLVPAVPPVEVWGLFFLVLLLVFAGVCARAAWRGTPWDRTRAAGLPAEAQMLGLPPGRWPMVYVALTLASLFGIYWMTKGKPWPWSVASSLVMALVVLPAAAWAAWRLENRRRAPVADDSSTRAGRGDEESEPHSAVKYVWHALIPWLILGPFLGWMGYIAWHTADAQERFQSVQGRVVSHRVETHLGERYMPTLYEPVVTYSYTVGGTEYIGGRFAFDWRRESTRQAAEAVVGTMRVGTPVTVRYDPDNPSEAVLETTLSGPFRLLAAILVAPTILALMCTGYMLMGLWRRRRLQRWLEAPAAIPWPIPSWGVLVDRPAGLTLAVRAAPLRAAVLTYSCAAASVIMAGIISSLVTGWRDDVLVAIVAIPPMAAVVAAVGSWWRRRATLVIDVPGRTVTFHGPKGETMIPFDEIKAWFVMPVGSPDYGNDLENRRRLLGIVTTGGQEVPIHIFSRFIPHRGIPAKVARELAALTGRPCQVFEGGSPESAGGKPARGLRAIVRAWKWRRRNRDYF
jgi:hypothetical protein